MAEVVENIKFNETISSGVYSQNGTSLGNTKHNEIGYDYMDFANIKAYDEYVFDEDFLNEVSESITTQKRAEAEQEQMQKYLKEKADNENDLSAANTLAVYLYLNNQIEEAIVYFEKANAEGYAPASRNLAILLEGSSEPDYKKITELYIESAKANDAIALNNLGCCYCNGNGVPIDYGKAIECFEKASAANDDFAKINLGNCYTLGVGVKQNLSLAYKYYREAAEMNNTTALRLVAECYLNGNGTKQNTQEAIACLQAAVNKGDEDAKQMLESVLEKSSPLKHTLDKQLDAAASMVTKPNEQTKENIRSHEKGGEAI